MNLQNRSTGEFFESAFFSEFTPSLNTHDIRPQVHSNYNEAPDTPVSPPCHADMSRRSYQTKVEALRKGGASQCDSSQTEAISYTYYPYGESTATVTAPLPPPTSIASPAGNTKPAT